MGRITINPYEKGPKKSLKKDIKTQDKEIEITSNGTIEVTPDEGFTYLNSVSVKTNVPTSGGGGSASTWRYFDVKGCIDKSQLKAISPFLVKTNERINAAVNCEDWSSVIAVGVDAKSKFVHKGSVFTWEEAMIAEGFMEVLPTMGVTEITEEEFYTIGNVEGNSVIEFTINGTSYQAEEGMTWGEWVNSDYNTGNFISNGSDILTEDSAYYVSDSITLGVFVNMEIEERQYILEPVDSGSSGGEEEGNGSFS